MIQMKVVVIHHKSCTFTMFSKSLKDDHHIHNTFGELCNTKKSKQLMLGLIGNMRWRNRWSTVHHTQNTAIQAGFIRPPQIQHVISINLLDHKVLDFQMKLAGMKEVKSVSTKRAPKKKLSENKPEDSKRLDCYIRQQVKMVAKI